MDSHTKIFAGFEAFSSKFITALYFLLPLFFIPFLAVPVPFSKNFLFAIGALVLILVWLFSVLKKGQMVVPKSSVIMSLSAVPIVYLLSAIFSDSIGFSIFGQTLEIDTAVMMFLLFGLAFLVSISFDNKDSIFKFYFGLFFSFLVIALFELLRLIFGTNFLSFGLFNDAVSTPLGSWNDFGAFSGLVIILSLITLGSLDMRNHLAGKVVNLALIVGVIILALVNLNVSWYLVILFSIFAFIYFKPTAKKVESERGWKRSVTSYFKSDFKTPLIVIIVSLVFIFGNQIGGIIFHKTLESAISEKLNIFQVNARPSFSTTYDIARQTLKTNPALGVGPNMFVRQWQVYKPFSVNQTIFWNTDFYQGVGIIPTSIITTGVFGFLAWIIFLFIFTSAGFHSIRKFKGDQTTRYLLLSSFVGAAYLWIMSVVYVPSIFLYSTAFVMTGIFVAASIIGGILDKETISFIKNPAKSFISSITIIILILSVIVCSYVVVSRLIAASLFNKGLISYGKDGNIKDLQSWLGKASAISNNDLYYRAISQVYIMDLNNLISSVTANNLNDTIKSQFQILLTGALENAKNAVAYNKADYQNWLFLGQIYQSLIPFKISGTYENAKMAYEEASRLNPTNPAIKLSLAHIEIANNDNKSARVYVDQALALKSNYSDAIFLLSQIEASEGNLPKAISQVEATIVISPNNPVLYFQLGLLKYNNNDYVGAISALEKSISLDSSYSNARYFLGLTYDKVGRDKDAISQFKEVLAANPDNQDVKNILTNLLSGQTAFSHASYTSGSKSKNGKTLPSIR